MKMYAANTSVLEPAANPSRPSVRFTPFVVPAIITNTHTTKNGPKLSALWRMNDRVVGAFVCVTTATVNPIATRSCPSVFAVLLSPRLRRRLILM